MTSSQTLIHISQRRYQRGAALAMALMILFVLTIIGIAAMGTTSLEAKMATNHQEMNRAFEAAETGLAMAANPTNLTLSSNNTPVTYSNLDGGRSKADVTTNYITYVSTTRTSDISAASGQGTGWGYFEQISTGTTNATKATTTLHRGMKRSMPAQNQ